MTISDPAELLRDLERMPGDLRAAAAKMDAAQWAARPDTGGFSLVEQAWHLADLEREGYGTRIRRLLGEDDPLLADFDGDRIARERSYATRSLEEGLGAFATARAANLALLRSLPASSWIRAGRQEGVGRVILRDIPRMMWEHDVAHRSEIAALVAGISGPRETAWA
jgi:hypothetical protein